MKREHLEGIIARLELDDDASIEVAVDRLERRIEADPTSA